MAMEAEVKLLYRAVIGNDVDELARLLDAHPHLMEARDPVHGCLTPLIVAASLAKVGVVRLLLERRAHVNGSSPGGLAALHIAAASGLLEIVSILLSSGADSSTKCGIGSTALMYGSWASHLGVVQQLLQHMRGRGLDERNGEGYTALWYASQRGHVLMVRALLLAGADHSIADNAGQAPKQVAEQGGHMECVALLEWWDGELERGYALHLARRVHEDSTTQQQAPGAPVPAYLRQRVERKKRLPRVQVQGGRATRGLAKRSSEGTGGQPSEEEKDAMTKYIVHDLAPELYIELMEGFHK